MDVTALGELLIDFAAVQTDPQGYPTMKANPGGAPGNFLAALNAYGAKAAFIGKVGDDAFGRMLVKTLSASGIETKGIVIDPEVFTTLAFVTFQEGGERSFSFARKPGADTCLRFSEVDQALIRQSQVFHFGTLSLTDEPAHTATVEAVSYAKSLEKKITFDPNLRKPLWRRESDARDAITWGLSQADFVKISDEEVHFLWDCSPEEAADKLLAEYGVELAFVTMGAKGAYVKNHTAAAYAACPKVHPVDTTGAGDICGGAAVSRLLALNKDWGSLTEAELAYVAKFAVTAASLSTEKSGGIPSIPDLNTVLAAME